jgi:hypothetical protein
MLTAFVAGLRDLGYVDGQNIIIERELSEANTESACRWLTASKSI